MTQIPHPTLQRVTRDGITPDVSRPGADRLIEGDPVHTTRNLAARGALYAGRWHSTTGT